MSDISVVSNGSIRPSWAVQAVDTLLEKVKTRPMWETIDFIVKIFLDKHPQYAQRADRDLKNDYGATKDLSFRHLLSIPPNLKDTIDFFFEYQIKNVGEKKFWREFAKRYPVFSVPERSKV